jgi:hypothetical protein
MRAVRRALRLEETVKIVVRDSTVTEEICEEE